MTAQITRPMPAPAPMASVQGTLALDYGHRRPHETLPRARLVPAAAPSSRRSPTGSRGPSWRWSAVTAVRASCCAGRAKRSTPSSNDGPRCSPAPLRATGGSGDCAARCAACTCSAPRPRRPRSACTCARVSAPAPSRPASSWSTAGGAAPPSSSADDRASGRWSRCGPTLAGYSTRSEPTRLCLLCRTTRVTEAAHRPRHRRPETKRSRPAPRLTHRRLLGRRTRPGAAAPAPGGVHPAEHAEGRDLLLRLERPGCRSPPRC